jgi:hypothetical protein
LEKVAAKRVEAEKALAVILIKEGEIEGKINQLEKKEEEMKPGAERRKLEKERWQNEKERREIEKKKWSWETEKARVKEAEGKIDFEYQQLLKNQKAIEKKIEEIDAVLNKPGLAEKKEEELEERETVQGKEELGGRKSFREEKYDLLKEEGQKIEVEKEEEERIRFLERIKAGKGQAEKESPTPYRPEPEETPDRNLAEDVRDENGSTTYRPAETGSKGTIPPRKPASDQEENKSFSYRLYQVKPRETLVKKQPKPIQGRPEGNAEIEEKEGIVFRPVPPKPSRGQKFSIRLIIFVLILLLLSGIFSLWYFIFRGK